MITTVFPRNSYTTSVRLQVILCNVAFFFIFQQKCSIATGLQWYLAIGSIKSDV